MAGPCASELEVAFARTVFHLGLTGHFATLDIRSGNMIIGSRGTEVGCRVSVRKHNYRI